MNLANVGYYIPDVPALYPHDMEKFWDMWNNNKELLTKTKKDNIENSAGNDLKSLYEDANFEGMITYLKNDNYLRGSTWKHNIVLEPSIWHPYVEALEERMPWYECHSVILWAAIKPVLYHIDPSPLWPGPCAIRSLIYDDNPSPTFKLRHGKNGEEQHVPYNKERNTFAFNNMNFYHGADYDPKHYKILMKSFGKIKSAEMLKKQIMETKEKNMPIWEVKDSSNE
jgi:hypothetical protein